MKLNLSDSPQTADLLAETLKRGASAVLTVNGNSMHPTLQMGWRVHLEPVTAGKLRIGELALFRGREHLTVHRLVWRESAGGSERLVFRGDYNRLRERVDPVAVIGRVVAVEVPGRRPGAGRTIVLRPDPLTWFYRTCFALFRVMRPLLPGPRPPGVPIGPLGRGVRALFAGMERGVSALLRDRR